MSSGIKKRHQDRRAKKQTMQLTALEPREKKMIQRVTGAGMGYSDLNSDAGRKGSVTSRNKN